MAKHSRFRINAADWIIGRGRPLMTVEQEGILLRLMCFSWGDGTKSPVLTYADDLALARLSGVSARRWKRLGPAIRSAFRTLPDGSLVHDDLIAQWEALKNPSSKDRQSREYISPRERAKILERDGFRCRRCGHGPDETTLEVDHVVPVARGGTNAPSNLQTLCWECNAGKTDTPPHEHDLRIVG